MSLMVFNNADLIAEFFKYLGTEVIINGICVVNKSFLRAYYIWAANNVIVRRKGGYQSVYIRIIKEEQIFLKDSRGNFPHFIKNICKCKVLQITTLELEDVKNWDVLPICSAKTLIIRYKSKWSMYWTTNWIGGVGSELELHIGLVKRFLTRCKNVKKIFIDDLSPSYCMNFNIDLLNLDLAELRYHADYLGIPHKNYKNVLEWCDDNDIVNNWLHETYENELQEQYKNLWTRSL